MSETSVAAPSSSVAARSDLREVARYCFLVFVAVRVGLFVLGLVAVALIPANDAPSVPGWDPSPFTSGWHNLFTAWERWDALWFLRIATEGYGATDGSAAFFPLYPLLVRGLSFALGGHPLAASLLLSNATFFVGLVLVYLLSRDEWDDDIARKSVLYLALFPTALFFFAPYSESLFLALSVGCLLAARRDRWLAAAALGALAATTRSMGILLILPLVLQAATSWRSLPDDRRSVGRLLYRIGASLFAGAGTFAYLLFGHLKEGEFWAPLTSQGGWAREFSFFWASLGAGTQQALDFIGVKLGGYHQLDWLLVAVALCASVWVALRARLPYALYTLAALLMPLSLVFEGRAFMSLPRFVLPLFPLFWSLAQFARRFRAHDAIVAVSAAGLGVMTVLFVNWYFVF